MRIKAINKKSDILRRSEGVESSDAERPETIRWSPSRGYGLGWWAQ